MRYLIVLLFSVVSLLSNNMITPIPEYIEFDREKALLGKKLFHDAKLSKDNTISCASCHSLKTWGVDKEQYSKGVDGQIGTINSPTVFNTIFNIAQFWDGRAKDLDEQARGPIHNPIEMGTTLTDVVEKLKKDPDYIKRFKKVFSDGLTEDNLIDAIAEFEKSLITPNSRFDRYLKGEEDALTGEEKEGYKLFQTHGCISCHHGVNIGGNLYQKFGAIKDYTEDEHNNLGRYAITNDKEDLYYFKVPSLRNVGKTPPYFHTGLAKDLKDAIKVMGEYQLGKELDKEDIDKIYKFLLTLTGETPDIAKGN